MAKRSPAEPDAKAKPLIWVASSHSDLRSFPKAVRSEFGQALYMAQMGGRSVSAKPLKGFGGAGVVELVENDDGNTYRAVYTVRFAGVVYVLHAFQKKSKSGVKTPPEDIKKIQSRLKQAEELYAEWIEAQDRGKQTGE